MRNFISRQFFLVLCLTQGVAAIAQVPLPGTSGYTSAQSAPAAVIPGQYVGGNTVNNGTSSPLPGSTGTYNSALGKGGNGGSEYRNLPISVADAKTRVEELKNLVQISRPQEVQDRVSNTSDWLADLADAHNKLANVFGRQDTMKAQSATERQTASKFAHLKNEVQLLKADLLIKQNRVPEALNPLVEIVVNEPKGSAGVAAYAKLKEIGFAEDVPEAAVTQTTPPPATVPQPIATGAGQHVMVSVKASPVNAKSGATKAVKKVGSASARTTTIISR